MNIGEGASGRILRDQEEVEVRCWIEHPKWSERPLPLVQLTELLLGVIGSHADAQALAEALLTTFRSISSVFRARPEHLAAVPGMTAGALRIIIAAEGLTCRVAEEAIKSNDLISSHEQFAQYARLKFRGRTTEAAYGLFLDRKNFLIREVKLGEGTVDHVQIYHREIVRIALLLDASAVIILHNHPSGDATPSLSDIKFTQELALILAAMNITLHDHYVLGYNELRSLRKMASF